MTGELMDRVEDRQRQAREVDPQLYQTLVEAANDSARQMVPGSVTSRVPPYDSCSPTSLSG